ncbi:uncharacterized protein B0I36DRAFT_365060 [Microdochium trichocladiopsis]|uniref:U1-type domain-containing protein n=1 Tax=Microdochium trichocladiopsis TaxID=1682393 RepID=A0A9P8Y2J3_9PEZI|nr:uncharacterized protein B0I36DRAFT_365060 [Microdochium trichocladiopsis]KAH7027931.1 hypothetical protein B0I36DRAFT_365060 [Microdochium trichocladiopsis]
MSEYWKSTPKYWCKHCSTYVRDTGLERKNHEATAKHQGALKRFLRDIHRDHEKEQREKDRAKREVERLNGVVGSSGGGGSQSAASSAAAPPPSAPSSAPATKEQRQRQWEQLAEMGIDVPTELRPDMAMAGTWTVTNTRVIDAGGGEGDGETKPANIDAIANGTRKRVRPEENEDDERRQEEEKAVQSLFKKPRRWGRDTKEAPGDDAELDALLSGTLVPRAPKKEEEDQPDADAGADRVKDEPSTADSGLPVVKNEELDTSQPLEDLPSVKDEAAPTVKQEDLAETPADADVPVVMFKKRKGKENIRQKKPLKP